MDIHGVPYRGQPGSQTVGNTRFARSWTRVAHSCIWQQLDISKHPQAADPMDAVLHQRSARRLQACSEQTGASKKLRHISEDDELILSLTATGGLQSSNTRLTATHKVRMMRTVATAMEYELQGLQSKWVEQIPEAGTRLTAQRCAREKYAANQSDKVRRELQEILQQQQFLLATLQTAVLRNSLHSSGRELFRELHFGTRLGLKAEERESVLMEHNKRSLAIIPSIVEKFAQMATLARQNGARSADQPTMPLSQIDITGCEDCTLVSSVFISEIPHSSLEVVYAAVLAYFDSMAAMLKHHFGVDATTELLNSAESPAHYLRSTFKRIQGSWTENYVMCSDLTPTHGMVHIDAVTDDPLFPVSASASWQYSICGLTVTPRKDPLTGKTLSVTLRWLVVYRYEMLPNNPAIQADLEIIRPILNGDLIIASVCSYIQELQDGRIEMATRRTWRLE